MADLPDWSMTLMRSKPPSSALFVDVGEL